jgi:uncharacterized protein (TIGR03083 family)
LGGLTEAQWLIATPLPQWCVRDVVAHLIGSESMLQRIALPQADLDVSTLEHVRNNVGAANEHWVRSLRFASGADMRERFRAVTDARRQALSVMTADEWNRQTATPTGPGSYGRYMRIRLLDCWMHEHDIRDGLGLPAADADLEGPASREALDELATAMGFVVGKLGRAPDGSRVAIELTGPLQRTINVAVQGRASVVDDFGGAQPTAVIRLDGLLFTRLAGGRTTMASHHDEVSYSGDAEVGRRIADNLKFVM